MRKKLNCFGKNSVARLICCVLLCYGFLFETSVANSIDEEYYYTDGIVEYYEKDDVYTISGEYPSSDNDGYDLASNTAFGVSDGRTITEIDVVDFTLNTSQSGSTAFAIDGGSSVGLLYIDNSSTIYNSRGYNITVGSGTTADVDTSTAGHIDSIINYGNVTASRTSYYAIYVYSSGSVGTIENYGTMGGIQTYGSIDTITNGSEEYTSAKIDGYINIDNAGSISTINNYGSVNTVQVNNSTSKLGTINNVGGTITTIADYGTIDEINNVGGTLETIDIGNSSTKNGTLTTLNNDGSITYLRINSTTSIIGTVNNGVDGSIRSITNSGTINEINNVGSITSTLQNTGTINEIANTGTIETLQNGQSNSGYIITLTNDGSINTLNNYRGTIETLTNNKEIGDISNGSTTSSGIIYTITNTSGATMGDITNYGTIGNSESEDITTVITNDGTMGAITNSGNIYGNIENNNTIETSDESTPAITNSGNIYGDITNNGTIIGDITNSGTIEGNITNNNIVEGNITNSGTIDEITNAGEVGDITNDGDIDEIINEYGATMGYIASTGSISAITNSGTMSAISYTNSDTTLNLTNTGTILLNSNVKSGDTYVQIYGNNINIVSYTLYINEGYEEYNAFSGYSEDDDASSHLTIGVDDNTSSNITIENIVIAVGDSIDTVQDYSLSSLVALYYNGEEVDYDDYSNYGISLSSDNITLANSLEYSLEVDAETGTFQINNEKNNVKSRLKHDFKYNSPVHSFYKNTLLSVNTLLTQSESVMYNTSYQRYGFRNINTSNASNGVKKDYVVLNKKPYSDFIQTAAYNEDSSNEDSQYSVESSAYNTLESSDDYLFFSPFVSHHSLYGDGVKGDGMSYGFISGYNKEIGNSLIGLHLGFDYGTLSEDNDSFFDVDTISVLLGIHYRYDFSNGMFIKARGDVYYAYHNIDAFNTSKQHPDTLGFNIGIATGKQWNITDKDSAFYGIFNLEGGINYLGLHNTDFTYNANYSGTEYIESHKDSFFNLLYANLDAKYDKMFGDNWIINMALGVKVLVTPLPEVKIAARSAASDNIYDILGKVNIDRVFGTAMLGVDYRINNDVSLMLNYLGIYGDKSMSNSGFFNVRVWW